VAYAERSAKGDLEIDGSHYDVDSFGMDDGRFPDPDSAFRFIFQLGSGWMIYLYVVQAGANGLWEHFADHFWTKDCAVAEVEMEDHGPAWSVVGDVDVPLNYATVTVGGVTSEILSQRFTAFGQELRMEIALSDGRLVWTRADAWSIQRFGEPARRLASAEPMVFTA
jgi:hypothetical protein